MYHSLKEIRRDYRDTLKLATFLDDVDRSGADLDVTVGTNNLLLYPTDATHTTSYIAPSAAPAQMLTDQIDRLIKEMYRMSGLDSVVGVQLAKSGVAKQWDFEKTNQKLADFAAQCEGAEIAIMKLFQSTKCLCYLRIRIVCVD